MDYNSLSIFSTTAVINHKSREKNINLKQSGTVYHLTEMLELPVLSDKNRQDGFVVRVGDPFT